MHWLGLIIALLIIGLIAGAFARLLVPGRDAMSASAAPIVLGIVGSFIGGFLGYVLFHKDKPATGSSSPPASSARSSARSSRC